MVRTGEPAGERGYFHEALLYNSDEEFLAAALPFVQDGVAAGEPVLVALGERSAELVQAALGDTSGVAVYWGGGRRCWPLRQPGRRSEVLSGNPHGACGGRCRAGPGAGRDPAPRP